MNAADIHPSGALGYQAAAQEQLNAPHRVTAVQKLLSLVLVQPQAVRLTKL